MKKLAAISCCLICIGVGQPLLASDNCTSSEKIVLINSRDMVSQAQKIKSQLQSILQHTSNSIVLDYYLREIADAKSMYKTNMAALGLMSSMTGSNQAIVSEVDKRLDILESMLKKISSSPRERLQKIDRDRDVNRILGSLVRESIENINKYISIFEDYRRVLESSLDCDTEGIKGSSYLPGAFYLAIKSIFVGPTLDPNIVKSILYQSRHAGNINRLISIAEKLK